MRGRVGPGLAAVTLLLIAAISASAALAQESTPAPAETPVPVATPTAALTATQKPVTHDWRDPGYPAVVDGVLYDPQCAPLESVGSNVLNLPYRSGQEIELEWMRSHNMRWLRVLATGHGLGPDRAPGDTDTAIAALQALLTRVESFNTSHDPSQSVYVLVGLTDYYPPGVPGEVRAFDHPVFKDVPVLPAPWYRSGTSSFEFDQEHNFGLLHGIPNYEQFYKPWVQAIVAALADRPSLLGWQLGNELKARGSPRNAISSDQAYTWYLAFQNDMVDTIRARDQHHLVFTGTQYLAELTDYEYRPHAELALDLVPGYRQIHQRMLASCGQFCWNVLGLTDYDFNPYALDDALLAQQSRVSVVMTEYGFTNQPGDSAQDRIARYGGDRAAALRNGLGRPWKAIDGSLMPYFQNVVDLIRGGSVSDVAAWASPAPQLADRGVDLDAQRGLTDAPDAVQMWDAWSQSGAILEATNRATGAVPGCLAMRTT